jgi:hypothetical protein
MLLVNHSIFGGVGRIELNRLPRRVGASTAITLSGVSLASLHQTTSSSSEH